MGRLVEMLWNCKYCGSTGIGGSKRECPNCGKPRDVDTKFELPSGKKTYVPEEEASKINRNPDWICEFCENLNSASYNVCQSCGAERTSSNLNYFENRKIRDKSDISPNISISEEKHNSDGLNTGLHVSTTEYGNKYNSFSFSDFFENVIDLIQDNWKTLLVIISLIAIVASLIYAFVPKSETIKVETIHWERSIVVEKYQTLNESSWSLPSEARLKYSRQEVYTYKEVLDHYESKSRQVKKQRIVSYEEKVVGYRDLGNGYAEEITERVPVYETYYETEYYQDPVYRNEPVYKTKYYYEIDRWLYDRTLRTAGFDKKTYWPDTSILTEKEREGSREEKYYISGTNSKGKQKNITLSYSEWNDIMEGDTIKVKVNAFGTGKLE